MVNGTHLRLSQLVFALALPVACSAILGIEDAERIEPEGSGGTSGDGGSSGAAGQSSDGTGGPTLCETYCETVKNNCKDDLEVYPNDKICLALCETMDPGSEDDTSGNTVYCRLNQAIAAKNTGEPEDHCPVSGLAGGGVCGENCDALCTAMLDVCKDEWASRTACLDDCEGLEDLGGYNTGEDSGPTVQCRIWHVGAATQAISPHCGHAAGAPPCAEEGQ